MKLLMSENVDLFAYTKVFNLIYYFVDIIYFHDFIFIDIFFFFSQGMFVFFFFRILITE